MSVENPSVLYVEQTLTPEQKERVCLNIGAQPTVAGKGLSSNDYTDAEKTKLSGIESGAEANVKPDWSAEAGSDAEILNKPSIPTVNDSTVTVKIGSSTVDTFTTNQSSASDIVIPEATETVAGAMTSADKRKLNDIESGAQANVKPDWNAASGADAEILNKPTIPTVEQTYDGTSANAQSGVAVASAISEIDEVPTVGPNDNGKVLKASYSGGVGSFSWQPESGGGGGGSYTAGDGIDISAQDVISAKTDGTTIRTNASGELEVIGGGGGEVNVIEGVKLDGAASVLTPDASKNVTIPNAVATGETGATNGLMTADDKKALGTAVQYVENPYEQSTPKTLIAQQMFVVESDQQIIDIVTQQSSLINGKGTLFFRITGV